MLGIQTKQMTTWRSCICPWFTDTLSTVCNSSPSYLTPLPTSQKQEKVQKMEQDNQRYRLISTGSNEWQFFERWWAVERGIWQRSTKSLGAWKGWLGINYSQFHSIKELKHIKRGQQRQAQNKHEKGVNLCNFLPMDTVNDKGLPWFKRTLDNYMEKKIIMGYWKYVLSIFSSGSPLIENAKVLEECIMYIFSALVLSHRHPLMTTVEYRSLVRCRILHSNIMFGKTERRQRNSAPCNTINSNDLNLWSVIWIKLLCIIFCELLKRSSNPKTAD